MENTRKFGERVQATENFQLKKYLADVISGQIAGYGVVPRSFTAGSGVEHAY
jgi:3-dehydroquinate dehydratase